MVYQSAFNKSYGGGNMMEMLLAAVLSGKGGGKGSWGGSWGGKGGNKGGSRGGTYKLDKSGGELGECTGKIKSFGPQKGYGFIETAEHGDVFLHQSQIKGYQVGMKVKLDVHMTADGKPHATNVRSGLEPGEQPPPRPHHGGNSSAVNGKGTFTLDTSGGELGEVTGKIKSFRAVKGFGFIETAEHGDVFLHADNISSYEQGQTVKFDAVKTKAGKVQAVNLRDA